MAVSLLSLVLIRYARNYRIRFTPQAREKSKYHRSFFFKIRRLRRAQAFAAYLVLVTFSPAGDGVTSWHTLTDLEAGGYINPYAVKAIPSTPMTKPPKV